MNRGLRRHRGGAVVVPSRRSDTGPAARTVLTLAIGAGGAAAAGLAGAPAPALTGPALVVSLAGVAGFRAVIPDRLRNLCFLVIGLGLGANVTPEILASARQWPVSLAAMVACVGAIMAAGMAFLRRGLGYDRTTAILATTPGHLSFVLGLSLDTGADARFVAVVQSLRVLMLTLLVPAAIAVSLGGALPATPPPGPPLSAWHLGLLAAAAAALGSGFARLRWPAAYLLAGMALSALGHATGATPGAVPGWLSFAAFVTMGTLIGTRFAGVLLVEIRRAALAAIVLTGGGFAIVLAASLAVTALVDLPLADVLIALAPGGLETMIAMAGVVGADPAFVGFHHVARLFLLSALIPAALARRGR